LVANQNYQSLYIKLYQAAFDQIDIASLAFFRIAFGAMMASWGWDYLTTGRVTDLYVAPQFHFSYAGLEWIKPWPGNGMYYHFLALIVLALAISFGVFYRISSLLFAIGFTLFFLMERTNYQNHYYLIALIAWLLPLLPLNQLISVDAYLKARRSSTAPSNYTSRWVLWALQFHIALAYFFGGIAKITPDWLMGQPMGMFLSTKSEWPLIGPWLVSPNAGLWMSWGGLVFDLAIVPALLYKRTRVIAYIAALAFHLANSCLFNIHVFPWFMIVATTLFFDPSWPRRVLGASTVPAKIDSGYQPTTKQLWLSRLALLYVVFHLLWPMRHLLVPGDPSWNEQGHLFSWRMMLRVKEVALGYALEDPKTGLVANVNHKQFMAMEQSDRFAKDPRLIVQFAQFLAQHFEKDLGHRPIVHAVAVASLNGRTPQLLVDPNLDLASVDIDKPELYIVPLTEPLKLPIWTEPADQWGAKVKLPPIEFLEKMKKRKEAKP
jgi:vitamin K-dependent gamma-carboxylase